MIPKKLRTRALLVARARRLTADVGLAGFTVQQLADDVGISRRTFFNHFPSKESAVLGIENGIDDELLESFVQARRLDASGVRRHLLDDLADVAIAHFESMNPSASDLDDLVTALQREPRLIQALIQSGRAEQQRLIDLLVKTDPAQDHDAAEVATVTFEALVRASVDRYLREGNALPFDVILRHRLDLARALFADPASASPRSSPTSTPSLQEHTA